MKKVSFHPYNLLLVYLLSLFFAFHVALPTFINSSFLNLFLTEKLLSFVYIIASVITIILFFLSPLILRKIGNYRLAISLIILEAFSLLTLILAKNVVLLILAFTASLIFISFFYFSLDIFLEGFSVDKKTGKIRGLYLTLSNLSWILSPLLAGFILTNSDYWKIYLASLLFLIPIFFILVLRFKNFSDSKYEITSGWQTVLQILASKNIRNIFGTNFLLNFFYSWMTIYTPLYLHKYIGFSWEQIGIIFSIMLLPFVFFQYILGKFADEKWGEKEILVLGFVIIGSSTLSLFFLPINTSLWVWAAILFVTRIGASSVEIMSDTYFFKNVGVLNANIISFFRMARPLAYILGPLVLALSLNLFPAGSGQIFLVLGLIMFTGLYFSLRIKDTK